ncbi:MAG: oligosaccharide flippase family protein [Tunicatimonas sp.]
MVYFSLSSFLGGSGSNIFRRVDSVMVTSMMGLFANGVYTTMFSIALVIEVPMAAIGQISQPIIAQSFATDDMKNIAMIYKKSSINQQLAGSLIFIGIWANLHNLFTIMPNGEDYSQGYWVVVLVGLSKLVDMATGSNNEIINMSQFYRFNMYMMLFLALFSIVANWLLIPRFGMNGAALATLLTIVVFNAVKLFFIYKKYKILPFTTKNAALLVITTGVLYLALSIDPMESAWLDIPLRSLGITVLFGSLVFFLRISEDANQLFQGLLRRLGLGIMS